MKIAIFDLDGCLSDDRDRRHLLPDMHSARAIPLTEKDWAAYHEGLGNDKVINWREVDNAIKAKHHIAFITARPELYERPTLSWLHEKFPALSDVSFSLFMRPQGNTLKSPELKVMLFEDEPSFSWEHVISAHDDRDDVLQAYARKGVRHLYNMTENGVARLTNLSRFKVGPETKAKLQAAEEAQRVNTSVPKILEDMAKTFRERNKVYGSNYLMVGEVMKVMFPEGLPDPTMIHRPEWHLFELVIVKLTRLAVAELKHVDSIHDTAVYAAMIEYILETEE